MKESLRIGGILKTSLIDYPGRIAMVIFTQGCNFRCFYCHNPELVYPEKFKPLIAEPQVLDFLSGRRGLLDGVVITGGEPLMHSGLTEFLYKIKKLGFPIKIDTNGSFPLAIKRLINDKLVDYIAMDIKAPIDKYEEITRVTVNTENILKSIEIIKKSKIDYEFRTTFVDRISNARDLEKIKKLLVGAKRYFIQKASQSENFSGNKEQIDRINNFLKDSVKECLTR